MRGIAVTVVVALLTGACETAPPDGAVDADTSAATPDGSGSAGADNAASQEEWPESGPVSYRSERAVDFTGDGSDETVIASAAGPAYDSLDIAITIRGAAGDTLWHETWPSLLYFKYEGIEGKSDTTIARIVRDHVEQLLDNDRFAMDGGLPAVLSRGGDPDATMREAIHYHLAELDHRRRAGLTPAQVTPPDAHSSISTDNVPQERVEAVLADVRTRPSFMYYAGGEATYAIAWSEQENAFVRISACC